jgi:hypothetical protein
MRKSTLHRITIVVVAVGLSQPLSEADDGIVSERRNHGTRKDADSQPAREAANYAYLAAKNPWLQRHSAPHSGSAISRLSLAGGLLQRKGCRLCSQT